MGEKVESEDREKVEWENNFKYENCYRSHFGIVSESGGSIIWMSFVCSKMTVTNAYGNFKSRLFLTK